MTLAKGIGGVQYGARPVPISQEDLPAVRAAAVDWFTALGDAIGPFMLDRENNLASSPAVLAALGALGNQALHISDPEARRVKCRQLADDLKTVNWMRGKAWEGIAGKFTPRAAFSLGGPKETAHAIFAALTNPSSEGYARLRGLPTPAPFLPLGETAAA